VVQAGGTKRTVTDIGYQHLGLVLKPLLISEKQKFDLHRCAKQVVIKVRGEKTRPGQDVDEKDKTQIGGDPHSPPIGVKHGMTTGLTALLMAAQKANEEEGL
jgi:hypothetical protein